MHIKMVVYDTRYYYQMYTIIWLSIRGILCTW